MRDALPVVYSLGVKHTAMITNPWINRITALVTLAAIYAAGYAGGKEQAMLAHQNHPACHANLKP